MDILQLKDKLIEVRTEEEYGIVHSFYVGQVKPGGWIKLMHLQTITNCERKLLLDWMAVNDIKPNVLAAMLGKSKSLVTMYCKGQRKIPVEVLRELGISNGDAVVKAQNRSESIKKVISTLKSALEELSKL